MKRIPIIDDNWESDGWFDMDIAERLGSDWEHDARRWHAIWRTRGGAYVRGAFSQYQGERDTYERISADRAALLLIQWRESLPADLESLAENTEI